MDHSAYPYPYRRFPVAPAEVIDAISPSRKTARIGEPPDTSARVKETDPNPTTFVLRLKAVTLTPDLPSPESRRVSCEGARAEIDLDR